MEKPDSPRPSLTVDMHVDTPWIMTKHGSFDLRQEHPESMLDLPRMIKGGLQAAFFALYLSDSRQDDIGDEDSSDMITWQFSALCSQPGCRVVDSPKKAVKAIDNGKVPIFLGLEGGRLIHNDLDQLRMYRKIGVRYLTLTHNYNTSWADSATDIPCHRGLTDFGCHIIMECNKLGILVDVSHTSDPTCEDAIDMSTKPVIASHSGCRAIIDHPRNLSNQLIKAIAGGWGMIGVPFARRFIGLTSSGIVNHIDHIVQLVGPLHVGIGSDLDGAVMADGIDVSDWRKITIDGLSDKGYSDSDIKAIAGGNILRLLD